MALKKVTGPTTAPVSLEEAKAHCRVDGPDSDALLTMLVNAAVSHLDGWTGILGMGIVTQTWELSLDTFPCREIEIPLGPLQSVTSVKYDDADGIEQTVDPSEYDVDLASVPGWVVPVETWPATAKAINSVRVRFVVGVEAEEVPAALKVAILLMVSHWNENREAVSEGSMFEVPMAVNALIAPYRRINV